MKRTREADTSSPESLYIVQGCTCYTGQGWDGCNCPQWVEATEEEYVRRDKWEREDVQRMVCRSRIRKAGNIMQWYDTPLARPCPKGSMSHKALVNYDRFSRAITVPKSYRFVVAYFLNGEFTYAMTDDIVPVITTMEQAQDVCRSTVNAAVFVDYRQRGGKKIWCFEQPEEGWLEPAEWIKPGGELAECVVGEAVCEKK